MKDEERRMQNPVPLEETDPALIEASKKARATLGEFIAMLGKPKPTISYFALKVKLEEKETVEYLWLNFVTYDGKAFTGNIANDAVTLRTYSFGQTVVVPPDRVLDWMIIDDGYLVGGTTLRVLRDRLSESQKKVFDERGGFKVK